MKKLVPLVIVLLILCVGLSWVICIGLIKLITMCFGLTFSLLTATGIWLILVLLNGFLFSGRSN